MKKLKIEEHTLYQQELKSWDLNHLDPQQPKILSLEILEK
tara:strand:+ start:974 stop:1093 length:120 start_codon:yes stop_codon:yes gene_type:complete